MRRVITLFVLLSAGVSVAQTGPHEMVRKMGRGINLGNTFSAPIEGNWSPVVKEQYFQDLADAGFTNIRIPFRFESYAAEEAPYDVADAYLDRVEEVTDWALERGLIAIIDVHGDHWFWESYREESEYCALSSGCKPSQETYDRFMSIWTHISDRFKNKSENLLFEVMNEAYFSMDADEVDEVNRDVLEIIRNSGGNNATRNVIVTGGGKNSFEAPLQLKTAFMESDDYLIATFHYYWPRAFTASADKGDDEDKHQDNDWGTEQDKADVDVNFDAVRTWSLENDIPVFVGEFGADNEGGLDYETGAYGNFGGPDQASRVAYYGYLAETSLAHGFSFAAWDAGPGSGKTIHLRTDNTTNAIAGTWVEDIKDALIASGDFCSNESTLANPGFECDFDEDWLLTASGISAASLGNALSLSNQGFGGAKVEVTKQDVIDRVTLSNSPFTLPSEGNELTVSCFAKGGQEGLFFRIRTISQVGSLQVINTSDNLSLTSTYQEFSFVHQLPEEVSTVQVQVLCGAKVGTYFFDDFSVENNEATILKSGFNADELRIHQEGHYFKLESDNKIERVIVHGMDGRIWLDELGAGYSFQGNFEQSGIFIVTVVSANEVQSTRLLSR